MGLFDKLKSGGAEPTPAPSPAPASGGVDLGKKSGAISLEKGSRVTIEKTPRITATCSWSSDTDYDLYALVLKRDGSVETVATFGTKNNKSSSLVAANGAVRHRGDVGRGMGGRAQEIIDIEMTDEVVAVVPVAYSAQSNGTGSFRRYAVSCGIDNGAGTSVTIDSKNASKDDAIYTVAIGIIRNTPDGVTVEALETYSRRGSENRPTLNSDGSVTMDAGPTNAYK